MKNLILFIFIFTLAFFKGHATNIESLSQVNKLWLTMPVNQALVQASQLPNNANFNDKIAQHLCLVIQHLKAFPSKQWNESQLKNRTELLNVLSNYAKNGIFPTNDYLPYQNPVFIDRKGVHCAVGYLMQQSGFENLAQEINQTQPFAYVKEIKHPSLIDWANEQGFTTDELAWIQPAYPSSEAMSKVSEGVDGEVLCMEKINSNTAIIGGNFTKELKNNTTCNNIALVNFNGTDYEIVPMLNGVNGEVRALYVDGNYIYIGGSFLNANGIIAQNIVKYDLLSSGQPYSAMGQLTNPVNAIIKYNNEILAASKSTNDLISKWNGTTWIEANTGLYGNEVRCFKAFNNELYIGGDFELPTGALRLNIAIYNPNGIVNMSHMGIVNPVNCFEIFQNELYVGCDRTSLSDSCALAKLTANEWLTLFKLGNPDSTQQPSIQSLLADGPAMHLFGNFYYSDLMYSSSHHARLKYASSNPYLAVGVNLNKQVNTSLIFNNQILFAGNFTQNLVWGGPTISYANRIACINQNPLSVNDWQKNKASQITLYPSPANHILYFKASEYFVPCRASIFNLKGQLLLSPSINNNSIEISQLPKGIYELLLETKEGKHESLTFLKESE